MLIYKHFFWVKSMLEIKNLRFTYGSEQLYNDLDIRLLNGEHVGLIGRNGCGKSTLMNLIAHKLSPDYGEILWDKNYTFSYLDQNLIVHDDLTIKEYLYNVYEELFSKEEEMNSLYESMAYIDPGEYDNVLRKTDYIQNLLEEKDFYMIKSKIGNIINGLGIDISENRLLKNLSGGQRAKVFLGKMLLEEKDVLLLDEPTNFLDIVHVEWLKKYLNAYKNAFIVISHNNEFLNAVCNIIVAIDNKKAIKYKGNYDDYVRQKTMNDATYEKEYDKQQKFIKKTEEFINANIVRATTTKRAQSRRKMLEKIEVLEKPQKDKKVIFDFKFTKTFNVDSISVKNLSIGYDSVILSGISLNFEFGKKYVITGKNGVGKTTFINTVLGVIPAISGHIKVSQYNDISYFKQEEYSDDINALDYFRVNYPKMDNFEIRNILARFNITGELVVKPMSTLSGGENAKVRFARMSLERSNLLILDEPTNHLDKAAKSSLLKAIKEYPGTVILVSHEKSFYKELEMIEIRF